MKPVIIFSIMCFCAVSSRTSICLPSFSCPPSSAIPLGQSSIIQDLAGRKHKREAIEQNRSSETTKRQATESGTVVYPNPGIWFKDTLTGKYYFQLGHSVYVEGTDGFYSKWVTSGNGAEWNLNDQYRWTWDDRGRWYPIDIGALEVEDTLFPYLNKTWIYMLDERNQAVEAFFILPLQIRAKTDVRNDMDFTLFTRSEPDGVLIKGGTNLRESSFDPKKPTKFITHGWLSSGSSDSCMIIKDKYMKFFDVNIIIMNWKNIANNYFYPVPMSSVSEIADYYAEFISDMIQGQKVNPRAIHLIGHSLGAQISGLAGKKISGKQLGRVTGLDPAFPGFDNIIMFNDRISNESAEFVDVIHSCGGFLGLMDAVGHADFYPNGGTMPQPGCTITNLLEACSHGRSWQLFADSIGESRPLNAIRCNNWNDFLQEMCEDPERIVMGELTPWSARGKYFLKTRDKAPFSLES